MACKNENMGLPVHAAYGPAYERPGMPSALDEYILYGSRDECLPAGHAFTEYTEPAEYTLYTKKIPGTAVMS